MKQLILFAVMLAAFTTSNAQTPTTLKTQPTIHDTTYVVKFWVNNEKRQYECNKLFFNPKTEKLTLVKLYPNGGKAELYLDPSQFAGCQYKIK